MRSLIIDQTSSIPPWIQLKQQIKCDFALGRLRPGDFLPSIRVLARQLGVGEATVRRAYKELTALGFLSAENRKYVMVTDYLIATPRTDKLAAEAMAECERLHGWARKKGMSSISFSRLLARQAIAKESKSPSYVYVDVTMPAAQERADVISRAWEIKVVALSLTKIAELPKKEIQCFTAILVSHYWHERLGELVGRRKGVFPVRMKFHDRSVKRIERLPAGSSVLLVFRDEDHPGAGVILSRYLSERFGKRLRFDSAGLGQTPDLAALAQTEKYQLIAISRYAWDEIPEKAKRSPKVISNISTLDVGSLEEVRLQAGILV